MRSGFLSIHTIAIAIERAARSGGFAPLSSSFKQFSLL